ncbi:DUF1343 domain-containing protein [Candidatus Sumerlaeota bacterium]|nr:DUF1343 domain-containing protein [Candidatus Sumerlaeota bacterium]
MSEARWTAAVCALLVTSAPAAQVLNGLDVLREGGFEPLRGLTVGVLCNQTSVTIDGEHILDLLVDAEGVTVGAAFAPEHGIHGTADAGAQVGDMVDDSLPYPIYSLYDTTRAPTSAELEGLDVIVCDIQGVGARFYTRLSTIGLVMDAAAVNGVPVMVLDRFNVNTGLHPEGPICEPEHFTFVGMYPIPVRYSLTIGELAQMIVAEGWIDRAGEVDLTVIPCRGWRRDMPLEETGRTFRSTSPNIPTIEVARAYLGTCFFEGTNVSEGRGTDEPFLRIGAPFIDAEAWVAALDGLGLAGVSFEPLTFTPEPNAGSSAPKFQGEECHGVQIRITDPAALRPVHMGLAMLWTLAALHPEDLTFREAHFDRLWGTSTVREALEHLMATGEGDLEALARSWEPGVAAFWERAQRYLLCE